MSQNDTEEKELPPTEHKLRKAREKGQVAQSQDFVGACTTTVGIFFLLFTWPLVVGLFDRVLNNTIGMMDRSGNSFMMQTLLLVFSEAGYISMLLLVILTIVGVGANILHKQGIPFSMHPIKPDFNKINPGEGFKKIFARRNATEFAISFVRLCIWFGAAGLIVVYFMQGILASAMCHNACLLDEANQILIILIACVVVLLMFAGLADLPIQMALFKHEQKMGHKELKRELKDTMGNPDFRQHRKYEHQNMLESFQNETEPSFYLFNGTVALSLFYHPEEAPVPRLLNKYHAEDASKAVADARKNGKIIINDDQLTPEIARSVGVNQPILERHLVRVAMMMVREGLV